MIIKKKLKLLRTLSSTRRLVRLSYYILLLAARSNVKLNNILKFSVANCETLHAEAMRMEIFPFSVALQFISQKSDLLVGVDMTEQTKPHFQVCNLRNLCRLKLGG